MTQKKIEIEKKKFLSDFDFFVPFTTARKEVKKK